MKACGLFALSIIMAMMIGSNARAIPCNDQYQRCLAACNKTGASGQRSATWCTSACANRLLRAQETGRWQGPAGNFACTR